MNIVHHAYAACDVFRHGSLKGAVSSEGNDRMNGFKRRIEQAFQCLDVLKVLVNGVLEFKRFPVKPLHPLALLGTAKYPACHVLGFYYKNTEGGHNDMVYLGCASLGGQGDVVNHSVVALIQLPF